MLSWIAKLAAIATDSPVAAIVAEESGAPGPAAVYGVHAGSVDGWLTVPDAWLELPDTRADSAGLRLLHGPVAARFAAAAPLIRPGEGVRAALWVLSPSPRAGGLTRRERETLAVLAEMSFEPLLYHFADRSRCTPADLTAPRLRVLVADDDITFRAVAVREFDKLGFPSPRRSMGGRRCVPWPTTLRR